MARPSIPPRDAWSDAAFTDAKQILCETSPYGVDGGQTIGRDPRQIDPNEFQQAGLVPAPLLAVIRAKCLDCCVEQADEVRKCVAVACPNWPCRMGANPFRNQNLTEEERERRAAVGRALAARRHGAS